MKILITIIASVAVFSFVVSRPYAEQPTVKASWYGDECAGKPTSSGEIYDPSQLTAAYSSFSSNLTNNGSDATIVLKEGYGDKFGRIRNDDIGVAMFRGEADGAITGTDTESATVKLTKNS